MFKNAIVRPPGKNFAQGLSTAGLGAPDYERALEQHARYCSALRECGLAVTMLQGDLRFPDSTFVEDTAVLTPRGAVLARPGAESRQGEIATIRPEISRFFLTPLEIKPPGTLDGGDICEAGDHFFLGLSQRTNEEGARQLAAHLAGMGYTSSVVDVRGMVGILHLKSGIASIGDNTLVVMEQMASSDLFRGYKLVPVAGNESYAANCVRVNDRVLVAAGYPRLTAELEARGFHPLILEMQEFQKMDGGLSCLSLRF
ncbi:MAG TPA: arginine deiminase family protein [Candidatus Angelobacter sp.]